MRAVRVLHFGDDASHRMQVLRSKGYVVESCANLQQMISRLRTGHDPVRSPGALRRELWPWPGHFRLHHWYCSGQTIAVTCSDDGTWRWRRLRHRWFGCKN